MRLFDNDMFNNVDLIDFTAIKEGSLVAVRWKDAAADSSYWMSVAEMKQSELRQFVTVGFFFLSETDPDCILLVPVMDDDTVGDVWVIPACQVRQFSILMEDPLEE
jgi:hypothetical protein